MNHHQQHTALLNRLIELQNDVVQAMGSANQVYRHLVDAEQTLRTSWPSVEPDIRTIYLQRAEGVNAGQGLTVRTLAEADAILGVWARTAPARGSGYDKTDVVVTFDDESETRLRVDLNCDTEDYLRANRPVYCVYVSNDCLRLGKEAWDGSEVYSQWALRREIHRAHNQNMEFIRLVVIPANTQDAHIVETTVSCDPLSLIKGHALLAKQGYVDSGRSIDGR